MFIINPENGEITMHKGDTGVILLRARNAEFSSADRAVFTIRDGTGEIIKEQVSELVDGAFRVIFNNSDTDGKAVGTYKWDVRYIWNPVYDGEGNIIDGFPVYTPRDPMNLFLKAVVGEI